MFGQRTKGAYLRLLLAVYIATFLIRAAFGIVIVTLEPYVKSSQTAYGLVIAATPFAELLTVLFIGVVIDRYGGRKVLLSGLVMGAISLYTIALTQNVYLLAAINALHGVAAACIIIPSLAILAQHTTHESRGREMGAFNFVNIFGYVFGIASGVLLLDLLEVRLTFIIAGALATASFLYGYFTVHSPAGSPRSAADHGHKVSLKDVAGVVNQRRILTLLVPWLFVYIFIGGLFNVGPQLVAPQEVEEATAPVKDGFAGMQALLILFGGALFFASQMFFGRVSDRYGREPVMVVGGAGLLGLLLTIGFGLLQAEGGTRAEAMAAVTALWPLLGLFALMFLAFPPAGLAALADEGQEGKKGITMSLYTLVLTAGFIIGPPLTGLAQDLYGVWGVLLLFLVLATVVLAILAARYVGGRLVLPPAGAPTLKGPLLKGPPP